MKIQRLAIQNFRSIQKLDIELPNVCALVGPNNAGKTNILEAIRRVLMPEYGPRTAHFSEDDVHLRERDRDIEIKLTFGLPLSYARLKNASPLQIAALKFTFDRYKRGENKGLRRLEQECLGLEGQPLMVQKTYGGQGKKPEFEPLTNIPQEIRDQIPFIHIGTDRRLEEQLPGARFSLLRRMFEDIDRNLRLPTQMIEVTDPEGAKQAVTRVHQFHKLIGEAMRLLKTEEFNKLEESIKRNALEQLGMDATADDIDLYFTPMDTMDFYKSLDIAVREGDFTISATRMGGGMQNAIVLAVLRAFEETRKQGAIILIEEPEFTRRCSAHSTQRCGRSVRPIR